MSAPTLREVYEGNEDLQQRLRYNYLVPLEKLLESTDEWADHEDKLNYLDSLFEQDGQAAGYAAELLSMFDPQFTLENYGEEVLVWTAANASTMSQGERLRRALEELRGYDPELLEKARLWCWQKDHSSKGRDILTQYEIAQAMRGEALGAVDLPSVLQSSAHPGVTLSDKRLAEYELIQMSPEASSVRPDGREVDWGYAVGDLSYGIWLDAPSGFALTYKGIPQALAAVAASSGRQDELMIYQLQGIRPGVIEKNEDGRRVVVRKRSSRGLMPLDWQKALIDITEHIAVGLGRQSVGIQAGSNNYWLKPRFEKEPHLTSKEAKRAYDKPAKRLGFKKGKDSNWHRPILNEVRV